MKKYLQAAILIGGLCAAAPVAAADFEVHMLNQGPGGQIMHFEPAFISIMPGDTVTFGGRGPAVTLTGVHGVTAAGTLPLVLEFSNAGLVHLTAQVADH